MNWCELFEFPTFHLSLHRTEDLVLTGTQATPQHTFRSIVEDEPCVLFPPHMLHFLDELLKHQGIRPRGEWTRVFLEICPMAQPGSSSWKKALRVLRVQYFRLMISYIFQEDKQLYPGFEVDSRRLNFFVLSNYTWYTQTQDPRKYMLLSDASQPRSRKIPSESIDFPGECFFDCLDNLLNIFHVK